MITSGPCYRFGITALYVLLCAPLFLRGQSEVVLDLIGKGLSVVNNNQERLFEAEFHRLHARALLVGGKVGAAIDVRSRLEQALTIARTQKARSLELRAAYDLAVLLREQGLRDEAYDALAPIYLWFTEGFETPDVIAVKALVADLTRGNPDLTGKDSSELSDGIRNIVIFSNDTGQCGMRRGVTCQSAIRRPCGTACGPNFGKRD